MSTNAKDIKYPLAFVLYLKLGPTGKTLYENLKISALI